MYYIYHIPGIKIGCTTNPKRRIKYAQKYTDYEILETHTDMIIAANRELELQFQYGYRVDRGKYNHHKYSSIGKKGGLKNVETGHIEILKKSISKERRTEIGKKNGLKNVENGHIKKLGDMWGKINGKRNVESGHFDKIRELGTQAAKIKNSKPILQYSKSGQFIKKWDSMSDVSRELNIPQSNISVCASGKTKSAGGFIWKYETNMLN